MDSFELIGSKIFSENFEPKPYSYGDWFVEKLRQIGFEWVGCKITSKNNHEK